MIIQSSLHSDRFIFRIVCQNSISTINARNAFAH